MNGAVWPMRLVGGFGLLVNLAWTGVLVLELGRYEVLGWSIPACLYDYYLAFGLLTTPGTRLGVVERHGWFFRHLGYRFLLALLVGAAVVGTSML